MIKVCIEVKFEQNVGRRAFECILRVLLTHVILLEYEL